MITKGEIELEKKYKQEQPKAAAPVVVAATKPELDVTLPSVRALYQIMREQQSVRLTLKTGDTLMGQVRWLDPECLCLAEGTTVTVVWQQAIACLQRLA